MDSGPSGCVHASLSISTTAAPVGEADDGAVLYTVGVSRRNVGNLYLPLKTAVN